MYLIRSDLFSLWILCVTPHFVNACHSIFSCSNASCSFPKINMTTSLASTNLKVVDVFCHESYRGVSRTSLVLGCRWPWLLHVAQFWIYYAALHVNSVRYLFQFKWKASWSVHWPCLRFVTMNYLSNWTSLISCIRLFSGLKLTSLRGPRVFSANSLWVTSLGKVLEVSVSGAKSHLIISVKAQ